MKQLIKTSKLAQAQTMLQKIAPVKILTTPKNQQHPLAAENNNNSLSDEEGQDDRNMAY